MKKLDAKSNRQRVPQKINLEKYVEKAAAKFDESSHWAVALAESGAFFVDNCADLISALEELQSILAERRVGSKCKAKIISALKKLNDYSRALSKEGVPLTVWGIQSDMQPAEYHLNNFRKIIGKYRKPDR